MSKYLKPEYQRSRFIRDFIDNSLSFDYETITSYMCQMLYCHKNYLVQLAIADNIQAPTEILKYYFKSEHLNVKLCAELTLKVKNEH